MAGFGDGSRASLTYIVFVPSEASSGWQVYVDGPTGEVVLGTRKINGALALVDFFNATPHLDKEEVQIRSFAGTNMAPIGSSVEGLFTPERLSVSIGHMPSNYQAAVHDARNRLEIGLREGRLQPPPSFSL